MAREAFPITPSVLTWARKRAGLSLDELSAKFADITDWESGSGGPTYAQLERLSVTLKVPIATFFFPSPPSTPPIEETFRTLPEASLESLPPRIRFLLRKAKAFQIGLSELNQGKNPARSVITQNLSYSSQTNIKAMASEVRKFLNISLEEQMSWKDSETALRAWRDVLYQNGVYVFKDAFKVEGFFGFCLVDEQFPIIYVNNTAAKTRQIFTLFHELAHLFFNTSGIDSEGRVSISSSSAKQVEIACNRFAAEFLAPSSVIEKLRSERSISRQLASDIASSLNVSRELIYRRFVDQDLVSEGEYVEAAKAWTKQKVSSKGGDPYNSKISYLGREYISLAFSAYYQNRIRNRAS